MGGTTSCRPINFRTRQARPSAPRMKFFETLLQTFGGKPIDWDELEASLIRADLGVPVASRILEKLKEQEAWSLTGINDVIKVARREIEQILPVKAESIDPLPGKPNTVLVVGVNGTGKTTSTAKLTKHVQKRGHTVMLAAADTFRAAAIEQLEIWGERTGMEVIRQKPGADPSAVLFDALQAARARKTDYVIVDTAGRLQTKTNLMAELEKMRRTASRVVPGSPHEVLLVLDATTGQNGLEQARRFTETSGVTGIVLAKLDGTAKGGVVIAIARELNLPIRYVGIGEKVDDLLPFDPEKFIESLFEK